MVRHKGDSLPHTWQNIVAIALILPQAGRYTWSPVIEIGDELIEFSIDLKELLSFHRESAFVLCDLKISGL